MGDPLFNVQPSIPGTGWVGAIIVIPFKRIKLLSLALTSTDSTGAEAAYLGISPSIATPATARTHPLNVPIAHGSVMNGKDLGVILNIELTGPLTLYGFVYHEASIKHYIEAIYEVLER